VGERNYRYTSSYFLSIDLVLITAFMGCCSFFCVYVIWEFILCTYTFAFSLTHLVHLALHNDDSPGFVAALRQTPITVVVIAMAGVAAAMLVWLLQYHYYLLTRNITTHEDYRGGRSAYDQGCKYNILDTLFGIRKLSRVIRHDMVAVGHLPRNREYLRISEINV
jgi:hypothetical protein